MKRRIATSIMMPLLPAVCLLVCHTQPAFAKSDAAGTLKTSTSLQKKPAEKKMEKVVLNGVLLITPEKEIEANVATADFIRFVNDIDTAVEYIMHASPQATTLLIKVECTPAGKTAQLIWKGAPEEKLQSLLDQLNDAIKAIENVKVKSGKVEFSMEYTINA